MDVYKYFQDEVEKDISEGMAFINIDQQMQDLRNHALNEYEKIHKDEVEILQKDPTVKQFLANQQAENKAVIEAGGDVPAKSQ